MRNDPLLPSVRCLLVIILSFFAVGCSKIQTDNPPREADDQPGQMIVQLKLDIIQLPGEATEAVPLEQVSFTDPEFQSLCQRAGVASIEFVYARQRENLPDSMKRTYLFHFRQGVEVLAWLGRFEQNPNVAYAEPNQWVYLQD